MTNPDGGVTNPGDGPSPAPGRTRAGLEEWVAGRDELPEHLLAAARVLADQVDQASGLSPLWGRYADVLRQLTAASSMLEPETARAMFRFQFELGTGCVDGAAHANTALVHCSECCAARDGLAEVGRWRPPSPPSAYGLDADDHVGYARAVVYEWLRRPPEPDQGAPEAAGATS